MHFIKEIKSHHLRQRRRQQRRATMNSANSNSSFHNNHHNQEMIICETLRYIAPNYAPQTAIRFGTSPSGTMQATEGNAPGLLRIEYRIRAALQRPYHPYPNIWHNGDRRLAFLPDTAEGRNVLLRFQYAFLNGLCFTIGQTGQVEWSNMLPDNQLNHSNDPTYLRAASQALNQLCIPNDSQVCCHWILQNQADLSYMNFSPLNMMTGSVATLPTTTAGLGVAERGLPSPQNDILYYDASQFSSSNFQHLEAVLKCKEAGKEEECPICLENMVPSLEPDTTNVVCIKKCKHRFHKHCIMQMFDQNHTRCPYCREPVGFKPHGQGPSGSMKIRINATTRCKGFEHNSDGVIELHYQMQGGIQLPFMENPGQPYSGTSRTAYLPQNESGRKLLTRLKYAFAHGLTFRVGTSISSGRSNQITWTSILHKTSLNHGLFGYPDPQYITDCNESLDALHVPKAEDCT